MLIRNKRNETLVYYTESCIVCKFKFKRDSLIQLGHANCIIMANIVNYRGEIAIGITIVISTGNVFVYKISVNKSLINVTVTWQNNSAYFVNMCDNKIPCE